MSDLVICRPFSTVGAKRITGPGDLRFLIVLASIFLCGFAWAQALPSAGSILRQQEQAAPLRLEQLPRSGDKEVASPVQTEGSGLQITLKSVRFTGAQGLISQTDLDALAQNSLGKSLYTAQLQGLADDVTQLLQSRGWFLARAYLPRQDLTEGNLEIAILAGRLEGGVQGIVLNADGVRLDERHVRAVLSAALSTATSTGLNVADLERALRLLNELPGVSAQSSLERGLEADSTRLTVMIAEGPQVSGSVTADNFGSRYTGPARATVQLRLNDPSRSGDQLVLNALATDGIVLGALNYSRPLGARGLGFAVNASRLWYRVGSDLAALGLVGTAQTAGAGLSYPLVLSNYLNLRASMGVDYKSLLDTSNGTTLRNRSVASMSAGLGGDSLDAWGGGGSTFFNLGLTQGSVDLSRSAADLAADQIGPRTHGRYSKASYALARLQKLPGLFTAYTALNGQFAANNLDSSEKFILGGSSAIRAYPSGEGSGDVGWVATLELRYDLPAPTSLGRLQWFGFFDTGRITLNKTLWGPGAVTNATNSNSYGLSGAGLGVTLTQAARYNARAFWARTLGSNPGRSTAGNFSDGRASANRFVVLATSLF